MSLKSKLNIQKGVIDQESINGALMNNSFKFRKKRHTADYYINGILNKNKTTLSKAITLIESTSKKDIALSEEIIKGCLPYSGKSIRIGITGVPGVGKSTFIEAFGLFLSNKKDKKIAVLAVDPSSEKTKGSILGDKTRMEELSVLDNVFIRPSPSSKSLGGVTRKTRETIILCEAFGFDTILIETVGVGQSEIAVHSMVDFFLLLMLSGAGDDLQGIKRGIMEMADAIALTKADNNNEKLCKIAKNNYQHALHLFPLKESNWTTPVLLTSSLKNIGIDLVWNKIEEYIKLTRESGYFQKKRLNQNKHWFKQNLNNKIENFLFENDTIKDTILKIEKEIEENKISPFSASDSIFEILLKELKKQ